MHWFVYIILCSDSTLYTGISNDVLRRFSVHAEGKGNGAKYFRGRSPKCLVYVESGHNRSSASKREAAIKKLSRAGKIRLIESDVNQAPQFLHRQRQFSGQLFHTSILT
ncbi:MAG: GIY-YIG nuclease family protein [Gammaproteobacteria bacterium]